VEGASLFIERGAPVPPAEIISAPRVGVNYAEEWVNKLLRFRMRGG